VLTGRLSAEEIAAELAAQYQRFIDLVGRAPSVVNTHQHVGLFGPVGRLLHGVVEWQSPRPFVRQVREPVRATLTISGARIKRLVLTTFGRAAARRWRRGGFPACHSFAGITDPPHVADPKFFCRWLRRTPGGSVELMCHPGYHDKTLIGRDCTADNEFVARRVHELKLLQSDDFSRQVANAGFRLAAPSEIAAGCHGGGGDRTAHSEVGAPDDQRPSPFEHRLPGLR
jgi:hypothetical protein